LLFEGRGSRRGSGELDDNKIENKIDKI